MYTSHNHFFFFSSYVELNQSYLTEIKYEPLTQAIYVILNFLVAIFLKAKKKKAGEIKLKICFNPIYLKC